MLLWRTVLSHTNSTCTRTDVCISHLLACELAPFSFTPLLLHWDKKRQVVSVRFIRHIDVWLKEEKHWPIQSQNTPFFFIFTSQGLCMTHSLFQRSCVEVIDSCDILLGHNDAVSCCFMRALHSLTWLWTGTCRTKRHTFLNYMLKLDIIC